MILNIQWLQNSFGVYISRLLLRLAHTIAGCDTTSRLFGVGKAVPLKKIKRDTHFQELAEDFNRNQCKYGISDFSCRASSRHKSKGC